LPGAGRGDYNRKFRRTVMLRLALGGRPTVGHLPLEQVIGVRIPASQPNMLTFQLARLAARRVFGARGDSPSLIASGHESLPPSQIHLATPSSFAATSCQFHFERALRTREGIPWVALSNASPIKTLASMGEFESQTDLVHDGGPRSEGNRAIESGLTKCPPPHDLLACLGASRCRVSTDF
jgi:hypothetical protein